MEKSRRLLTLLILTVLCLGAKGATADDYKNLYLDILPFYVDAADGEVKEFQVDVVLHNPEYTVEEYEFFLYLPRGIKYVKAEQDFNRAPSDGVLYDVEKEAENSVHFLLFNLLGTNKFKGTDGRIATLTLTTTSEYVAGIHNIELKEILIQNGEPYSDTYDSETMAFSGDLSAATSLPKLHGRYTADALQDIFEKTGLKNNAVLTSIDFTEAISTDATATVETANKNLLLYLADGMQLANEHNVVTGSRCGSLLLTDGNYPFSSDREFTAANVTFNRTYAHQHSTICLPFDLTPADIQKIGTVYAYQDVRNQQLHYTPVESASANQPYLLLPNSGTVVSGLGSKTIPVTSAGSSSADGFTFEGTLEPRQLVSDATTTYYGYLESSGKFIRVGTSTGAHCKPFRAFFSVATSNALAKELGVVFDEATGIHSPNAVSDEQPVYGIDGRKARESQLRKSSIFIKGGKKVIKQQP